MNNDPKSLSAAEIEIRESRQKMDVRNTSIGRELVRLENSVNELARINADMRSNEPVSLFNDDARTMSSASSVDITLSPDPSRRPEEVIRTGLYHQYRAPTAHYTGGFDPASLYSEAQRGNVSYEDKREHSEEVVKAVQSLEDDIVRIQQIQDKLEMLKVQRRNALTEMLSEGRMHEMHRNNLIDASKSAAKHLPIAEEGRRIEKKMEQEEEKDMMALTEDMVAKGSRSKKGNPFKRMFGKKN